VGGCRLKPKPCTTPDPDPQSGEEENNEQIVRDLIERVWNYTWTPTDEAANAAARAGGDYAWVPASVQDAIDDLRSPLMVRHREDVDYGRVKASGPDDYKTCVNAVHAVVPNLHIEVLHIITDDDRVVAHLLLEGTDSPVDPATEEGAFGNRPPTGQTFNIHATAMYRISNGKIVEDWLGYGGTPTYGVTLSTS
jgi:predicted ester cyclase